MFKQNLAADEGGLAEVIVKHKSADLDGSPAARSRLDQEGANHGAFAVAKGFYFPNRIAARCAVKGHGDAVGSLTLVTKNILAWFQRELADLHRYLGDEEV